MRPLLSYLVPARFPYRNHRNFRCIAHAYNGYDTYRDYHIATQLSTVFPWFFTACELLLTAGNSKNSAISGVSVSSGTWRNVQRRIWGRRYHPDAVRACYLLPLLKYQMLTSRTPARITPTPAHCPEVSRSRRNIQARSTVTALYSEVSAVAMVV